MILPFNYKARLRVSLLVLPAVASLSLTEAEDIDGLTNQGFEATQDGSKITATGEINENNQLPFQLYTDKDYEFDVTMSGTGSLTSNSDKPVGEAVSISNEDSALNITNTGNITYTAEAAQSTLFYSLSTIISATQFVQSTSPSGGLTVTHNGQLSANSSIDNVPDFLAYTSPFISAISAQSYGQFDDSDKYGLPGSTVTITTNEGSKTELSNTGSIWATGLIATSQVESNTEIYTSSVDRTVTVNHGGEMTVDSDAGSGIYAHASGVVYESSSASVATGGDVVVNLNESGSITTTGKTSVGIYALSEVSTPKDASGDQLQGGSVTVNLNPGSGVFQTGGSDSKLALGVLAVSTGQPAFLAPYEDSTVSPQGNSGAGGKVTVTSDRAVTTEGEMSIGITALSLGGDSMVTTVSSDNSGLVNIGNAKEGVTPGNGDQVNVTTTENGDITTLGTTAHGIVALSATGGGVVLNELEQGENQGAVLGDSHSGSASNGGSVSVTNGSNIQTGDGKETGAASMGIVAQSIGGGGGNAGGKHASFLIGGAGGAGGDGGEVSVNQDSSGSIHTQDSQSTAILAQSIGGGGGNGANAKGLFISIGGNGGKGGDGGKITSKLSGAINTSGDYSPGAILQSIGGGGGHSGNATTYGKFLGLGIGGSGGDGGDGGAVTGSLESGAKITTVGEDSSGLHLQSIGGGGGTGGTAASYEEGSVFTLTMALGGSGGSGGSSGDVTGTNDGTIKIGSRSDSDSSSTGGNGVGIYGQSISGGGGHGGSSSAKSYDFNVMPEIPGLDVTLSFGGTGGSGGQAGTVTLNNNQSVTTNGDLSVAMLGQSIGGGGGHGGKSDLASKLVNLAPTVKFSLSMGGGAGSGGFGGAVSLNNGTKDATTAILETYGDQSVAMLGQSIGGGGGHGGSGDADSDTIDWGEEAKTFNYTTALGGTGGDGGDGNPVTADNYGTINTHGAVSAGILIQSIGGGGGKGHDSEADGGNTKNTINVSVGGAGGDGGQGSDVTAHNYNAITTEKEDSVGVLAQSIGGGGGDGGKSSANSKLDIIDQSLALIDPDNAYTANVVVGGKGGDGNGSGDVTVTNESNASIETSGSRSYGILGQSISGGGGKGAAASAVTNSAYNTHFTWKGQYTAQVSVGGNGGSSPTPGKTEINNQGTIATHDYSSHAIFAQSIGGGGGVGGSGSVDTFSLLQLGAPVDGASKSEGPGGEVAISNLGSISTDATQSLGILAQSVGGGGGYAFTGDVPTTSKSYTGDAFALEHSYFLGNSDGGSGSDGGTLTITNGDDSNAATVATKGDWSFGILGQSVGAGGGKASSVVGASSTAYAKILTNVGAQAGEGSGGTIEGNLGAGSTVSTEGYGASGVVLQSVGGGGGVVTVVSDHYSQENISPVGVQLGGGDGTIKGGGGNVYLLGESTITTKGDYAHGVVLQSIAGGGGLFGAGTSNWSPTDIPEGFAPLNMNLGALTDADNNGGVITVSDLKLDVTTEGANAFGMVAQSIGGGGGLAMAAFNGELSMGYVGGGKDRNGGVVEATIQSDSSIKTSGAGAHGMVVQSIGGGGGIAAPTAGNTGLMVAYDQTNTESHGYGDDVSIVGTGKIQVTGKGAAGVLAQVIGGGGGIYGVLVGTSGAKGSSSTEKDNGTLTIATNGDITSTGEYGYGVFAQNITANGSNGNKIEITVDSNILANEDTSSGIFMHGGNSDNVVNITSGNTVKGGYKSIDYEGDYAPTVNNEGKVSGSVDLATDDGALGVFNNMGKLLTGATIAADINNFSEIYIGLIESSGIQSTFAGEFNQNATGSLYFDIFSLDNYDHLLFEAEALGSFEGSLVAMFDEAYLPEAGHTYELISGSEDISYSAAFLESLLVEGLPESLKYAFTTGANNSLNLNIIAVPEPGAYALVVGLILSGLAVLRRRQ